MYTRGEKVVPVSIEEEMQDSYISYAMSVIVGRALPDVRDGLKPVHRRILYAMQELNLEHNKPYKKSARIVGSCLGQYHPHGDMAVYDALVRMAQDFSLRYPLIDGQGNFGSVDGDAPAAMRYTEARLASISDQMLADLEKDTVDFVPNFDASLKEPVVLPSVLPNLLINGSSGIAVGMATNIPPHNLGEIAAAIVYLVDNPEAEVKDLMRIVQGPDFPTGGMICGKDGIKNAYTSGRGKLLIRAKVAIERQKSGKDLIVVSEIPYQVNKSSLIAAIADLVEQRKTEGVSDIRDESDKDGMRIVIELKRGVEPQLILNQLYKHTQLEITFGIICLALVGGRPKILSLKQVLLEYVAYRKNVIRRRTQFELDRALKRAHILEGLKIALKFLDKVIKTIRASKSAPVAKEALMKNFKLSSEQAQAILEMQLQRLTALERDKIDSEYAELLKTIELCRRILASEKKVEGIIKEEILAVKQRFGDERRTEIVAEREEIALEDLIAEEDMAITISHSGYIKRLPVSTYHKQRRGGKGITGAEVREEDFIEHLFIASTKNYLLVFTDKGKVYWLKVYEIPQAGRASKGKAIINLLQMSPDEAISSVIAVKEFSDDKTPPLDPSFKGRGKVYPSGLKVSGGSTPPGKFLLMITRCGLIKKIELSLFSNPRKAGIIALTVEKSDQLVGVQLTDGTQEALIATSCGKAIRFSEQDVREMGRAARGVRGIRLAKKDVVIGMEIVKKEATILTVTENGFGKRTDFDEYRRQSRGGKGIINLKTTQRNGNAVALKSVKNDDELIMITQSGMLVRCAVKGIRSTGRSTQGVHLIKLASKDKVACVARVVHEEVDKTLPSKEQARSIPVDKTLPSKEQIRSIPVDKVEDLKLKEQEAAKVLQAADKQKMLGSAKESRAQEGTGKQEPKARKATEEKRSIKKSTVKQKPVLKRKAKKRQ